MFLTGLIIFLIIELIHYNFIKRYYNSLHLIDSTKFSWDKNIMIILLKSMISNEGTMIKRDFLSKNPKFDIVSKKLSNIYIFNYLTSSHKRKIKEIKAYSTQPRLNL